MDKASVSVWAIVNPVTCQRSGFNRVLNKYNPSTNRMWSSPFGTMC